MYFRYLQEETSRYHDGIERIETGVYGSGTPPPDNNIMSKFCSYGEM